MKRLELSQLADADLNDILHYGTKRFGVALADRYYFGFQEAFDLFCRYPEVAQLDPETQLGLRVWAYRQHRIFYRVEEDAILIVRILHHSTDVARRFDH